MIWLDEWCEDDLETEQQWDNSGKWLRILSSIKLF